MFPHYVPHCISHRVFRTVCVHTVFRTVCVHTVFRTVYRCTVYRTVAGGKAGGKSKALRACFGGELASWLAEEMTENRTDYRKKYDTQTRHTKHDTPNTTTPSCSS